MTYIEGISFSGTADGRMECDNGKVVVTVPIDLEQTIIIADDYRGGQAEVSKRIEFSLSAYQLRKLAEWAAETADDMDANKK